MKFTEAASSFKENRIGTSHDKKKKKNEFVYSRENEIKTAHLSIPILALH